MDIKTQKSSKQASKFFQTTKKKFIYIYMYIYSKRQHQKESFCFYFSCVVFLLVNTTNSTTYSQQLFSISSSFDYPHNSSCGYDWIDVTTTNGKTLPKKVFCFVSLFSVLFFQRVAIYFISFIFKQENFYSVSGGTLRFYSIVNDILFLH
jgi:hypothetical protein